VSDLYRRAANHMVLLHCAELVITGIKYAGCDGTYRLNDTCTSRSACEVGEQPTHWSKGDATDGRQMWWCGKDEDDPAGKYTCTPWTTTSCGGSFGSTDKEGAGYSCTRCAAGWGGEDCKESLTGWGGVTLIIAVLCLAGYLGGGVALGVRKNGAALGLAAHPHRARWAELAGLCRDGIRFTQQKLRGSRYAGSNRRGATEPLAAAGRAQPSNHRQNKSKDKGKDKEGESKSRSKSKSKSKSKGDTRHQQEMEYSPPSDSSVAAHDANGDRTEPRKAQLSEQHIVAKNLHQSQAKIAVMGLNEM
jgi:hypothetical protein